MQNSHEFLRLNARFFLKVLVYIGVYLWLYLQVLKEYILPHNEALW